MEFKIIAYGSAEYQNMVELRYKILREPLGLTFSEADLEKDKTDFLLAAFFPNSKKIVGCCILTPISESTVQLRQMAVDNFLQKQAVGSGLLLFAQEVAVQNNYRYLYLHAREEAVDFYKKHGYAIEGDRFIEVGIPHFEMLKQIQD